MNPEAGEAEPTFWVNGAMSRYFRISPHFDFDVAELQRALAIIEPRTKVLTPLGENDVGAIGLTRIPGDPESANVARGIFWTCPDQTYKEVQREDAVDEDSYTEFVPDYDDTYFREVYDTLSKKHRLGRVRLLWKTPRTALSWHRDPEPRLHLAIVTNPGAHMVIGGECYHMPADGRVWLTDTTHYHTAFNGGEENRVHLVATVLETF